MSGTPPELTDPFEIGGVRIANRVLLAPLAGIGNWFVRLQAKRHGAGLAVSSAPCASSWSCTPTSTRSRSSSSATTPR
jgi:hypothetical protein